MPKTFDRFRRFIAGPPPPGSAGASPVSRFFAPDVQVPDPGGVHKSIRSFLAGLFDTDMDAGYRHMAATLWSGFGGSLPAIADEFSHHCSSPADRMVALRPPGSTSGVRIWSRSRGDWSPDISITGPVPFPSSFCLCSSEFGPAEAVASATGFSLPDPVPMVSGNRLLLADSTGVLASSGATVMPDGSVAGEFVAARNLLCC